MSKKKITIFITVFIITGIIILGVYSFINRHNGADGTTPGYQDFNPFGTGTNVTDNTGGQNTQTPDTTDTTTPEIKTSKFSQITDFAIAGATFYEDTRPINPETKPEPTKILIDANIKEGRMEIQKILNETLSLNPPLVVDGIFGKKATTAIKSFQKANNLEETGKVDEVTAPYFTKTIDSTQTELFEKVPSLSFVEKKNGHIYKMPLDTKVQDKVSNSTIPNIYESFFNSTANTVVYRYLSQENAISSFMATLGEVRGDFLPQDAYDFSVSKDKTRFFFVTKNNNGALGVIGYFGNPTKRDFVFNSPFTEWISDWDANGRIFLTTKPAYNVTSNMFLLNTTNKTITKIFGGVTGLTTMINPNGSTVLFSSTANVSPKITTFDISKHTMRDLDTYGLSDKCIWSRNSIDVYCAVPNSIKGNQYPDIWYQGLVSFDDYFVKINTQTGEKVTIANSIGETPIDGINLFLNNKEDTLFFTNKKDFTLWSLDLK